MPETIVAATTAAVAVADSPIITVPSVNDTVTLLVSGLGAAEEVDIYINTIGTTYEELINASGSVTTVSLATGNVISLDTPGNYKILKPVTAGAVGISKSSPSQV